MLHMTHTLPAMLGPLNMFVSVLHVCSASASHTPWVSCHGWQANDRSASLFRQRNVSLFQHVLLPSLHGSCHYVLHEARRSRMARGFLVDALDSWAAVSMPLKARRACHIICNIHLLSECRPCCAAITVWFVLQPSS